MRHVAIATLCLILLPGATRADSSVDGAAWRDDLRLLGWTGDGRAVLRHARHWVEDGSGFARYTLAIVTATTGDEQVTSLVDVTCEEDDTPAHCAQLARRERAASVTLERRTLAALGPLAATGEVADPVHALGRSTLLRILAADDEDDRTPIDLALVRPRRDPVVLARLGSVIGDLWDAGVTAAWPSPEGNRVVVVASWGEKAGCWDPTPTYRYLVVDRTAPAMTTVRTSGAP